MMMILLLKNINTSVLRILSEVSWYTFKTGNPKSHKNIWKRTLLLICFVHHHQHHQLLGLSLIFNSAVFSDVKHMHCTSMRFLLFNSFFFLSFLLFCLLVFIIIFTVCEMCVMIFCVGLSTHSLKLNNKKKIEGLSFFFFLVCPIRNDTLGMSHYIVAIHQLKQKMWNIKWRHNEWKIKFLLYLISMKFLKNCVAYKIFFKDGSKFRSKKNRFLLSMELRCLNKLHILHHDIPPTFFHHIFRCLLVENFRTHS